MWVMVGSPSFLCEQTGMAGCAMVGAVAHGADNACGVVVVSAGSPQCSPLAPPRRTSAVWSRRRSQLVAASATRKRNDGFIHGKPVVA